MELAPMMELVAARWVVIFMLVLKKLGEGLLLLLSLERMETSLMSEAVPGAPRMTTDPSGILSSLPAEFKDTERRLATVPSYSGSLKFSRILSRMTPSRVSAA